MRHISIPLKAVVNRLRRRAHGDRFTRLAARCESSPIEEAFWAAGYAELSRLGKFAPQVKVGSYRLDFALVGRNFKIAIECDGYEFHSTEAQISADNSRDLDLARDGWIVVRFTGGRIWRDVQGCVGDVVRLVRAVR
ncbi:MAG: endonuclease domain-containing protein [Planctomycetota bacterium]|jgi:very-short-patch-repair endonuclease